MVGTLARQMNFRPKSVLALPLERRTRLVARMGQVSDLVAARLLVSYHLAHQRPMMKSFLDALGVKHEDGLLDENLEAPGEDKLLAAGRQLMEHYPAEDVRLYFRTLLLQDPETWGGLQSLAEPASELACARRRESACCSNESKTAGCRNTRTSLACEGKGEAIVVDPRRDIDAYLDFAAVRNLRITHVLETHIHADFASGAGELAERTGRTLPVGLRCRRALRGRVSAPRAARRRRVADRCRKGSGAAHGGTHAGAPVLPRVRHGASRRHADGAALRRLPVRRIAGRPDLLGEEAKRGLARRLYASVRDALAPWPDGLEIAPGHGAGSMCGAGMSGRSVSTLGFERIANPYLQRGLTEEAFVDLILANVPPFPPYYRRMKQVNASGPRILDGLPGQQAIPAASFRDLVENSHVVIDLRDQLGFGAGHIPGSFGIGSGSGLSTWASWVVPYDRPLLLVAQDAEQAREASRALVRVGLDDVRGYLAGGIEAWIRAGYPVTQTTQIAVTSAGSRLASGSGAFHVIDVREHREWMDGHIAVARHIPGGELADRAGELRVCPGPSRSCVRRVTDPRWPPACWNARDSTTSSTSPAV